MTYTLESIHRVYCEEDGTYIEVSIDEDAPGLILITESPRGSTGFEVCIGPKDQAVLVAQAILALCASMGDDYV